MENKETDYKKLYEETLLVLSEKTMWSPIWVSSWINSASIFLGLRARNATAVPLDGQMYLFELGVTQSVQEGASCKKKQDTWLWKRRVMGDYHARCWERFGVKFPLPTRLSLRYQYIITVLFRQQPWTGFVGVIDHPAQFLCFGCGYLKQDIVSEFPGLNIFPFCPVVDHVFLIPWTFSLSLQQWAHVRPWSAVCQSCVWIWSIRSYPW